MRIVLLRPLDVFDCGRRYPDVNVDRVLLLLLDYPLPRRSGSVRSVVESLLHLGESFTGVGGSLVLFRPQIEGKGFRICL